MQEYNFYHNFYPNFYHNFYPNFDRNFDRNFYCNFDRNFNCNFDRNFENNFDRNFDRNFDHTFDRDFDHYLDKIVTSSFGGGGGRKTSLGATIRIGQEIRCLPYAVFFLGFPYYPVWEQDKLIPWEKLPIHNDNEKISFSPPPLIDSRQGSHTPTVRDRPSHITSIHSFSVDQRVVIFANFSKLNIMV